MIPKQQLQIYAAGLDIDCWPAGPEAFFTRRDSSGQWI